MLHHKFLIFVGSLIVAYYLFSSGAVEQFLFLAKEWEYLGVFIAGLMFTSVFTVAPATVVLGEIAAHDTLLPIALIGGLGAAVADTAMLFWFENKIRLHLANNKDRKRYRRLMVFFATPGMHALGLVVGAVLIILPLPDELGLALMGVTNVRIAHFFPIAFVLNAIGVYLVGLAAVALL